MGREGQGEREVRISAELTFIQILHSWKSSMSWQKVREVFVIKTPGCWGDIWHVAVSNLKIDFILHAIAFHTKKIIGSPKMSNTKKFLLSYHSGCWAASQVIVHILAEELPISFQMVTDAFAKHMSSKHKELEKCEHHWVLLSLIRFCCRGTRLLMTIGLLLKELHHTNNC